LAQKIFRDGQKRVDLVTFRGRAALVAGVGDHGDGDEQGDDR
jgi:hypothetical protein